MANFWKKKKEGPFGAFLGGISRKMNPILGKRPSRLRKESNFMKFKQILGKHQNKIEEKNEPDPKMVSKNRIGTRDIRDFMKNWKFLGKRPPQN